MADKTKAMGPMIVKQVVVDLIAALLLCILVCADQSWKEARHRAYARPRRAGGGNHQGAVGLELVRLLRELWHR
ncbi:MAG: hypothetical protein M3P26_04120 [Gemmatimonadota bacterium]|nr:hypothetical protein [Gemmatimonadota bacterium]